MNFLKKIISEAFFDALKKEPVLSRRSPEDWTKIIEEVKSNAYTVKSVIEQQLHSIGQIQDDLWDTFLPLIQQVETITKEKIPDIELVQQAKSLNMDTSHAEVEKIHQGSLAPLATENKISLPTMASLIPSVAKQLPNELLDLSKLSELLKELKTFQKVSNDLSGMALALASQDVPCSLSPNISYQLYREYWKLGLRANKEYMSDQKFWNEEIQQKTDFMTCKLMLASYLFPLISKHLNDSIKILETVVSLIGKSNDVDLADKFVSWFQQSSFGSPKPHN